MNRSPSAKILFSGHYMTLCCTQLFFGEQIHKKWHPLLLLRPPDVLYKRMLIKLSLRDGAGPLQPAVKTSPRSGPSAPAERFQSTALIRLGAGLQLRILTHLV